MTAHAQLLNGSQLAAVTHQGGPLLVLAGPGTGKTKVLVHRLDWLLAQGVPPESILLLTFTNRASRSMLSRASELSGNLISRVEGGTFHSVGSRLLRKHGWVIGLKPDFTVIDTADAQSIIRQVMITPDLRCELPTAAQILSALSAAVNKNLSPIETFATLYSRLFEYTKYIDEVALKYAEYKASHRYLDFDDLLVSWHRLLSSPRAAELIQYQHVLVDEYQDVNSLQTRIVSLLAASHNNVTAVGDDAQAIYSFRGADPESILHFQETFPSAAVVRQTQTYRLTPPNAALADSVFKKGLISNIPRGPLPVVHAAYDEQAEAEFVVSQIRQQLHSGLLPSEIAVLARSAADLKAVESCLLFSGIPYHLRGGCSLTEAKHVKDFLAYFRILANPRDVLSWTRVLKQIEHVGDKTALKVTQFLLSHEDPLAALKYFHPPAAWSKSHHLLVSLLSCCQKEVLVYAFDRIKWHYSAILTRDIGPDPFREEWHRKLADLEALLPLAQSAASFRSFVEELGLEPPDSGSSSSSASIALSTVHSYKGLEARVCFVIRLIQGRFPFSCFDPVQAKEERRLFYVALTRSSGQLFLTWPMRVTSYDKTSAPTVRSPFLRDIPFNLYQRAR